MKTKDYLKELSLTILGVLIALLIDNYRENVRDDKIISAYIDIIKEDLNIDIRSLTEQLKDDSTYASKLGLLTDEFDANPDLPRMTFALSSWTKRNPRPYRNLSTWDSLDYYTIQLYQNNQYRIRQIGFSTLVNSNLSHRVDPDLLKRITVYYTTDSDYLDFVTEVDDRCHWLGIEYLNGHQGSFQNSILNAGFDATQLRNEVSGRYSTTLNEMYVKGIMLTKAKELLTILEKN